MPSNRAAIFDAVAHQVAVALLDDIAEVNADPKDDAPVLRHARIAFDHCVLHLDGAAHSVDHAAKLDQGAIAGSLNHTPVVHGDCRVD